VNRALILLLSIVLTVVGPACEPAPPRPLVQPTASPALVPPLVIGAIMDVGNDAGPDSGQRAEAAKLAVELVNRRGGVRLPSGERRVLELIVYDDAGRADRASAALSRLLEDGALAIIGPTGTEAAVDVRPAAEAGGIPLIALDEDSGGESSNWRWTFSLAAPAEEAVAAAIDFFTASGVDRFGWLAPRTMGASSLRRAVSRIASNARMQVVGDELYAPGEEDHIQSLSRLQASDPRVILAWPRDSHEAAAIAREASKVRDLVPIFLGPAAASPSTLTTAGDAATGVRIITLRLPVSDDLWDHDSLTPVIRDFRREFQARTGRPPTSESAGAWDAVRLIVSTLEHTAPTRVALRDGLENTTDYLGASGAISFSTRRHDGLDGRAFVVARAAGRRWRLPP
jgi:branched-chain amino acid transport system substrate-binding protein